MKVQSYRKARILRDYLNGKQGGPRWREDDHIEEASDTGYYIEEGPQEGEFFLVRYEPETPASEEAENRVVYGHYLVLSDLESKLHARQKIYRKIERMGGDWLVNGIREFVLQSDADQTEALADFLVQQQGVGVVIGGEARLADVANPHFWIWELDN